MVITKSNLIFLIGILHVQVFVCSNNFSQYNFNNFPKDNQEPYTIIKIEEIKTLPSKKNLQESLKEFLRAQSSNEQNLDNALEDLITTLKEIESPSEAILKLFYRPKDKNDRFHSLIKGSENFDLGKNNITTFSDNHVVLKSSLSLLEENTSLKKTENDVLPLIDGIQTALNFRDDQGRKSIQQTWDLGLSEESIFQHETQKKYLSWLLQNPRRRDAILTLLLCIERGYFYIDNKFNSFEKFSHNKFSNKYKKIFFLLSSLLKVDDDENNDEDGNQKREKKYIFSCLSDHVVYFLYINREIFSKLFEECYSPHYNKKDLYITLVNGMKITEKLAFWALVAKMSGKHVAEGKRKQFLSSLNEKTGNKELTREALERLHNQKNEKVTEKEQKEIKSYIEFLAKKRVDGELKKRGLIPLMKTKEEREEANKLDIDFLKTIPSNIIEKYPPSHPLVEEQFQTILAKRESQREPKT